MTITNIENVTRRDDERVKPTSWIKQKMMRPELGAIGGTLATFLFFALMARGTGMFAADGILNWSTVSAQFVIVAVGACLLMIAGEFDLSVGSMVGFAGMLLAILIVTVGLPGWLAIVVTFCFCCAIGALIGWLVIATGLPSFIVSLAFLFILRGLTIWSAVAFSGQMVIGGVKELVKDDPLVTLFNGKVLTGLFSWLGDMGLIDQYVRGSKAGLPIIEGIPMLIVWAVVLILVGQWVLTRTRYGNWIFASGGDQQAARYVGVPVKSVKIAMFALSAFCATLLATTQVFEFGSAAADRGLLKEFEAIICVIIGGALLTGGYGSVVGAALGAIIFGVVQQGLFFTDVEASLFRVFLGTILLVAVIANTVVRRMVTGERG